MRRLAWRIYWRLVRASDVLVFPFVYPSAWLLKYVRRAGVKNLPRCKNALMRVGVFPILDHYYEPQFDNRSPTQPFSQDRALPGIDWNVAGQLRRLATFTFASELADLPREKPDATEYFLDNGAFGTPDAECWYQMIRSVKPKRIIEIGSGFSTLMAVKAIRKNGEQDPGYKCEHVCVEPYEMPWLEEKGVAVVRRKVEDLDVKFFSQLEEDDILFIDSSHVIRPQGDVVFEYLELLPTLNKGVIVHIHDIFSPKNYLERWLVDDVVFWNEQYLVEAFLSNNGSWEIIGALNYLCHNYYARLKSVAPFLTPGGGGGSLYIRRIA